MMKKQSILSWLLTFCLCFAMAMPALATDDFSNQDESFSTELANYNLLQSDNGNMILEDTSIVIDGEPKTVEVEIHSSNERSALNIDENAIKEAYYRAMNAYENEMAFDDFHNPIGTYDYSLVGEDETYFYEQTSDTSLQPHMDVFVLSDNEKLEMKTEYAKLLLNQIAADNNDKGYFGRVYVENTTVKPSSCDVMLPTNSEISVQRGTLYIYTGFSGGTGKFVSGLEADLGVQYSQTYGLWKAFMTISGGSYFLSNYENATNVNGYLPGKKIAIVCNPCNTNTNINGTNDNLANTVILKIYGTAKYADKLGNGGNTPLTSIIESNSQFKLVKVSCHKWLATMAEKNVYPIGHNIAKFSNVSINNVVQSSDLFKTAKDGNVSITGISNGAFTIDVKS